MPSERAEATRTATAPSIEREASSNGQPHRRLRRRRRPRSAPACSRAACLASEAAPVVPSEVAPCSSSVSSTESWPGLEQAEGEASPPIGRASSAGGSSSRKVHSCSGGTDEEPSGCTMEAPFSKNDRSGPTVPKPCPRSRAAVARRLRRSTTGDQPAASEMILEAPLWS